MAVFSFEDLTVPLTRDEVKQSIYNVLGALGVDVTAWESGAVTRAMVTASAAGIAALSTLTAEIAKSGFVALAEADWLKLVAEYVYNVDYIQATFASGTITLTNAGGGLYIVAAGDLQVAHASTGKTYRNVAGFTLNPLSALDVDIQADETGSASTAATGTITTFVTALSPDVTCTNAAAVVGTDEEQDPALRLRCREKLGSLSPNGPWDAYAYVARSTTLSTGESAGITRTRVTKDGYGNVSLYVASASGTVGATELAAVTSAVETSAVPLAVAAETYSASAHNVTVQYSLWAYNTSGLTDQEIKDAVETALIAFFAALPIGGALLDPGDATGYVYRDQIFSVIDNALDQTFHVVLTSPAADEALTNTEVAVLVHDTSTDATVLQVPPPEGTSV